MLGFEVSAFEFSVRDFLSLKPSMLVWHGVFEVAFVWGWVETDLSLGCLSC